MNEKDLIWQQAKFSALLEACSHAINRARYVFAIINIAGIAILAALFNSTLPWLRNAIERAKLAIPPPDHLPFIKHTMYEELWTISIPLLGIKFSVFDVSVIGSTCLFVLALWYYYSVRRENQVVHIVVGEANSALAESKECARYLYHGIAHYFVFTTRLEANIPAGQVPLAGPTAAIRALLYMPAWVPLLIVISDLFTVVAPYKLAFDPANALWTHLSTPEKSEVIIRLVFALTATFCSYRLCRQSVLFDTATRRELEDLQSKIR